MDRSYLIVNKPKRRTMIVPLIVIWLFGVSCGDYPPFTTTLSGTVVDSTGKPLPGFTLAAHGYTAGGIGLASNQIETTAFTTDPQGHYQQTLSWHDKIASYRFAPVVTTSYPYYTVFENCAPPVEPSCKLYRDNALKDMSINFRAQR